MVVVRVFFFFFLCVCVCVFCPRGCGCSAGDAFIKSNGHDNGTPDASAANAHEAVLGCRQSTSNHFPQP